MGGPITFESIYNLVRNEKKSDALQKLDPDIYEQIVQYLVTKISIYRNSKEKLNSAELEKLKAQITSARKLVKELYERRERKISHLAINKSRTKSDVVDDSALLEEEKPLYKELTDVLNGHRKDILMNLVNAKMPSGKNIVKKKEMVRIRFTGPVPKFLGQNMEIYGPFDEQDIASLPSNIAGILIRRGRAVEL